MNLATAAAWTGIGALMAAVNGVAIALTLRHLPSSTDRARSVVMRTLPLRLLLQGICLYGAVRVGPPAVLGWLLGFLVGRAVMIGLALGHTDVLGGALRRG